MSLVARFGAGCFYLIPVGAERDRDSWEDVVRAELEKIPSISEVDIDLDGDWVDVHWLGAVSSLVPQGSFLVQPGGGTLAFEVSIPFRVQEDMSGGLFPILQCSKFRVVTFYEYEGPATLVRCLEGDLSQNDPSDAVIVVREFLEKELRTRRESALKLVTIGPSPFHANFSIVSEQSDLQSDQASVVGEMIYERRGQLGYAEYVFCKSLAQEDAPFEEFSKQVPLVLARQLAFFYWVSIARSIRIRNADAAERMRESLVERYRSKGFKAFIYRVFRSGAAARYALIELIEFENIESRHRRQYESGLREFESQGEEVILSREMEESASLSQLDDLKSARETVSALDDVRKKEFEVAVVSLSTLLGALAGAAASLIAG